MLISSYGYEGQKAVVTLKKNGKVIDQKVLSLNVNNELRFEGEGKESGLSRYSIEIERSEDEQSMDNNSEPKTIR